METGWPKKERVTAQKVVRDTTVAGADGAGALPTEVYNTVCCVLTL